jgi:hypothetical protein
MLMRIQSNKKALTRGAYSKDLSEEEGGLEPTLSIAVNSGNKKGPN